MASTSRTPTTVSTAGTATRKGLRVSKVCTSRVVFLVCLVGVAFVIGFVANRSLTNSEETLAKRQFASIAERALAAAQQTTLKNRLATITLASIASNAFPDAQVWPFVNITGYEEMATNAIQSANGQSMGLCPLVTPDQLSEFEDFAYDKVLGPKFPPGTGVSSFGPGVYGLDAGLDNTDHRFHETDGATSWGSPNTILTPFLFHSSGGTFILMGNYRTIEGRGRLIDDMIACAEERAASSENPESIECSILTDITILGGRNAETVRSLPSSVLLQPIYPSQNSTVVSDRKVSNLRSILYS